LEVLAFNGINVDDCKDDSSRLQLSKLLTASLLVSYNSFFKYTLINKVKDLQKLVQDNYYVLVFLLTNQVGRHFYLNHYYDFRGRWYSNSPSDPTFNKLLRNAYFFENELLSGPEILSMLPSLKGSWFFKEFSRLSLDLENSRDPIINMRGLRGLSIRFGLSLDFLVYYVNSLLLEVGKLNKKLLITGDLSSVTLAEMQTEGLRLITLTDKELELSGFDLSEIFEIIKSRTAINTLFNEGVILNITLNKDSTASSLQHWATILQPKEDSLACLNFRGDL